LKVVHRVAEEERLRVDPLIQESTELIAILTAIVRKSRENK
jgi:hypothetical protein